jgi:hypothetical protein
MANSVPDSLAPLELAMVIRSTNAIEISILRLESPVAAEKIVSTPAVIEKGDGQNVVNQ